MTSKLLESGSAVIAAALIAAAITVLPGTSDTVVAGTPIATANAVPAEPRTSGPLCQEQAWPYYQSSCLRDRMAPAPAKPVRIVTADRIGVAK